MTYRVTKHRKPPIGAAALWLVFTSAVAAQVSPTTPRAAIVRITEGPALERADPNFAIIRWTSDNPGGSPVHYGVVQYGTDPKSLSETAKSPLRINPAHTSTVFRVRVSGLKPQTTYYYEVTSIGSNGDGDGVKSAIKQFTTPANLRQTTGAPGQSRKD